MPNTQKTDDADESAEASDASAAVEPEQSQAENDEFAPTPLDHPMFLPVLFAGLAVWFGYDGYLTTDPDMLEHQDFNRYGFRFLIFAGLLYGYRGACEMKNLPSHALVLPGLLLLSTLWLAHDGWLVSDEENPRAPVNRELVPWLLALTGWYSFTGWLRTKGSREPAFVLPLLILACAAWFGYNGFLNDSEAAAADLTLNRWAAAAIFGGFLVSAFFAIRRPAVTRPPSGDETPPQP